MIIQTGSEEEGLSFEIRQPAGTKARSPPPHTHTGGFRRSGSVQPHILAWGAHLSPLFNPKYGSKLLMRECGTLQWKRQTRGACLAIYLACLTLCNKGSTLSGKRQQAVLCLVAVSILDSYPPSELSLHFIRWTFAICELILSSLGRHLF